MTDRDVRTGAGRNLTGASARTILPLPEGEGWGEGIGSDVNPCRGLVARHRRRFSVGPKESITLTPGPSPGGRGEKKVLVLES
jgi:hypothetical protein